LTDILQLAFLAGWFFLIVDWSAWNAIHGVP